MNELDKRVTSTIEDPQTQRRLSLRVPHLLVGNSPFASLLVREIAARRLVDGDIATTRDKIRRGVMSSYREFWLDPGAKISEARDIAHNISKYENDADIILCIRGFEHLALKSQDVLLKRFEETPASCFLIAQVVDSIARTIISRCHLFHVPALEVEESMQLLLRFGWKNKDLTIGSMLLARGDVDRVLWWLSCGDAHSFVQNWRQGPAVGLQTLLDHSKEIPPAYLDCLFCGLKHYLAVGSNPSRCLEVLSVLPRRLPAGMMSRQYLLDQYTLCVGGFYGMIKVP